MTEHKEQRKLIIWASFEKKNTPELALLFAIPNAAKRTIHEAQRAIGEGLKAGVPDLCLPVGRGKYLSLWIEMKHGKNTLTKQQKKWKERLERQGHKVVVCYSFEEAKGEILNYLCKNSGHTRRKH